VRPPPPFTIAIDRLPDAVVVRPIGELDMATTPSLAAALQAAEGPLLVLDLSGLTFIDSTGLTLTLQEHRRAERDGRAFALADGDDRILRVFRLMKLDLRLPFTPDVATALDGLRR
jgi:anti-sigma B factor antagonist